jgi:hypothetical protein
MGLPFPVYGPQEGISPEQQQLLKNEINAIIETSDEIQRVLNNVNTTLEPVRTAIKARTKDLVDSFPGFRRDV